MNRPSARRYDHLASPHDTTATTPRRPDAWEWRRQRAWELHQQGWWQKDIAAALGVSCARGLQWLQRRREGGAEALRTRPQPGPTPRLTAEQRAQLPGLLLGGAAAYGLRGDVWTARRVADVIGRTFGVRYHPDHVRRLLRQIGWRPQPPVQRARPRDAAAIRRRYAGRWPALRKKPARKGAPSSG